jgi:phage tail tape-measure protein
MQENFLSGEVSMKEKQTYQEQLKKKLRDFSDSLTELTFKAEQLQDNATLEFEEQMDSLRDKQQKVREKLRELEEASDEAWDDIKDGIEHAWADIKKGVDSAWSRFQPDRKDEKKLD